MTDLSEFQRRHKNDHPTGWEPSLQWDGSKGSITTGPLASEPDASIWEILIADWGLDPSRTQVVDGSLQIRAWDTTRDGETIRMKYYRATIEPRTGGRDHADIKALCELVEKRKAKPVTAELGDLSFVVLLSDWQLGKGNEVNGGSKETTERILHAIDSAVKRLKDLKKVGRPCSQVILAGLGDLVEGCEGWYPMQTWASDLTDREQDKLARRLILHAIDSFVDAGYPVVAFGVPGNHGENRRNGKAFTDWLDNRDYAAFETVSEILAANPERYANVAMPNVMNADDLSGTLDISGVPCSFIHGHQVRNGTNAQAKLEGWWKGQALGRTPVSDAEILFSGHLHHLVVSEVTGRTVIQVPAMDGGSKWFTASSGSSSQAGMVTLTVGRTAGLRGWSDLLVV